MRIGINVGYWSAGQPPGAAELVAEADRLGLDSVWTAEAYGSDVLTPLAWWGAQTTQIRLGTAIAQMSAREPAATAMAAITMDHLSNGRFILGLGVSGPQVVEGWYGKPFAKPLARTREYISIIRQILAREGPVTFEGEQYRLPLEGGTGLGKPLKSSVHPLRPDLPIFLAAEGPKNVALAAESGAGACGERRPRATYLPSAGRPLSPPRAPLVPPGLRLAGAVPGGGRPRSGDASDILASSPVAPTHPPKRNSPLLTLTYME